MSIRPQSSDVMEGKRVEGNMRELQREQCKKSLDCRVFDLNGSTVPRGWSARPPHLLASEIERKRGSTSKRRQAAAGTEYLGLAGGHLFNPPQMLQGAESVCSWWCSAGTRCRAVRY